MKTKYEYGKLALALGLICSAPAAFAQNHLPINAAAAEGAGGHGGGIVSTSGQDAEPADLHYMPVNFKLPVDYGEMKFDQYPGLNEELKSIAAIIHDHYQDLTTGLGDRYNSEPSADPSLLLNDKSIEFYLTSQLSGADPLSVDQGWSYQQIAYTYEFKEVNSDYSSAKMRKIVEVNDAIFKTLKPTYQALIVWHEILHHSNLKSHALISPFVKGIDAILKVRADQVTATGPITPEQKSKIKNFYSILQLISGFHPTQFAVSNQGGLILSQNSTSAALDVIADKNEIDASSVIKIIGTPDVLDISNNSFRSSSFALNFRREEYKKAIFIFRNNRMNGSEIDVSRDLKSKKQFINAEDLSNEISGNEFHESRVAARLPVMFENNKVNKSAFSLKRSTLAPDGYCTYNTFDQVVIRNMTCDGNNNLLSNVQGFYLISFNTKNNLQNVVAYADSPTTYCYDINANDVDADNNRASSFIILRDQASVKNSKITNLVLLGPKEIKNSNIYVERMASSDAEVHVLLSGLNLVAPALELALTKNDAVLKFDPKEKLYSEKTKLELQSVQQFKNEL